tara:strand:+ start:2043 stop:2294 length:252 start_codon:yes stop_codon:yes gene_type:complete
MYQKLWNLYNSFDTNSKRCLIIDFYSLLFIVIPTKYFLTKRKISLWILLLFFLLGKVKGKEEKLIKDDNFIYKINKKNKFNMI